MNDADKNWSRYARRKYAGSNEQFTEHKVEKVGSCTCGALAHRLLVFQRRSACVLLFKAQMCAFKTMRTA